MSFKEKIKELRDQVEEVKEKEAEQETEIEEVAKPEEKEEEKPEEKVEEPAEEKKEEPEPDKGAYQRLRREAAANKKRADEAAAKNADLEARLAEKEKPEEKAEESNEIAPEIVEMVRDHRMVRAEKEFESLEAQYRRDNPDYDAVAKEYAMALAQSYKVQNPRLSNIQIAEKTKETILIKAAGFMKEGFDPIDELYHEAKELGFTGKKTEAREEKEEPKPDMKKVAANRQRNAGMAGSSGKSESNLTPTVAAGMQTQEWMRLSKSEKAAVFAQLAAQR